MIARPPLHCALITASLTFRATFHAGHFWETGWPWPMQLLKFFRQMHWLLLGPKAKKVGGLLQPVRLVAHNMSGTLQQGSY